MAVAEFPAAVAGEIHAPSAVTSATFLARIYFGVLSLLALGSFVFGIENRLAADALLPVAPPVDLIPPLTARDWSLAFVNHQQDPLFAACGGAVSLAHFKILYWWEWMRQASLIAVVGGATIGLVGAGMWPRFRLLLPRLGVLAALALFYWIAGAAVELAVHQIGALSRLNTGQYRHAVDVTFASVAVAAVLASTAKPPRAAGAALAHRVDRSEWLWIAVIVVDIGFGGLFAARNAAAFWPTWPGYEGGVLPPLGQLVSYSPWWLNFTFNPYTIQLVHRALSGAIWIAALWQLISSSLRADRSKRAHVRFLLITGQTLTGIATLVLGVPAALSMVHQIGAIFLLAASFIFLTGVDVRRRSTRELCNRSVLRA
jgi:cytochrome c oxidase assembly protein subunit 15